MITIYRAIIIIIFFLPAALIVAGWRYFWVPEHMDWDFGELLEDAMDEIYEGKDSLYKAQYSDWMKRRL